MAERLVRRLSAFRVSVPDTESTATFLETGLDFERRPGDRDVEHLTTEGDYGLEPPDRLLSLCPGAEVGVAALVFEIGSQRDLDAVRDRVERAGGAAARLDDGPDGGMGLAFDTPDGLRVECRLPAAALGDSLRPSDVRPRRLGHVNLKVPDPPKTASYFSDALGLRLTEQLGDMLFFLRVNSDHHNLAFRPTQGPSGIHHVAFEVPGWDSFRVICDHLAARGHQIEYGPGRHAPGHQLFVYLRDPSSGLRLELFTDMAHIDDDETFKPIRRDIDRARSLNVWGPAPPPSFLE